MMPNDIRMRSAVFPQCTGQTDRPTHVRTDRPTDRPRESLTTIGCYATRATRPNNNNKHDVNKKNHNNNNLEAVVTKKPLYVFELTLSPAIPLRLYTLPYWSNPPFLIFDIRVLWRSVLSTRAPECQKLEMVG